VPWLSSKACTLWCPLDTVVPACEACTYERPYLEAPFVGTVHSQNYMLTLREVLLPPPPNKKDPVSHMFSCPCF